MKLRRQIKKLLIQSLCSCVQAERSLTVTFLVDQVISLKETVDKQDEMEYLLRNLGDYKPKKPEKIKSKQKVLKNAHTKF